MLERCRSWSRICSSIQWSAQYLQSEALVEDEWIHGRGRSKLVALGHHAGLLGWIGEDQLVFTEMQTMDGIRGWKWRSIIIIIGVWRRRRWSQPIITTLRNSTPVSRHECKTLFPGIFGRTRPVRSMLLISILIVLPSIRWNGDTSFMFIIVRQLEAWQCQHC